MTQHEAVEAAMRALGGYATFGQLYQTAPHVPQSAWRTKTPFASIRRIVQDRPEFFRIRPGLWGLTERQAEIEALFAPAAQAAPKSSERTHAFFQGLLVQLGNWRRMETCVPAQDKNQPFQDGRLHDAATLAKCFEFTYPHIVAKARAVDVVWFNARRLPDAFFEVEHSTDIYNSLLKFVELQDFRARQFIVADDLRRREFEARLAGAAFADIQKRVEFLDYDTLIGQHQAESQIAVRKAVL